MECVPCNLYVARMQIHPYLRNNNTCQGYVRKHTLKPAGYFFYG